MTKEKPYKQVIIFGPDNSGSFEKVLSIAPKGEDYLIIGDGKKNITLHEIEEALQGKINDATRIDVCAHGRIDPMDPTKSHIIALGKNYFDILPTYTSSLFTVFNKANHGNPVYTHLWSCYADNANKEFSYLSEGSLAIFHSSKNSMSTFTGNNSLFNYSEYDNSFSGAKKNLSNNLEDIITTGGTIKFSKLKKEIAINDLESLSFALTFNPIVTASDIEIAKTIFGTRLPNTILKNMEQLFEKHKTQGSISPSCTISSISPKVKTQVK